MRMGYPIKRLRYYSWLFGLLTFFFFSPSFADNATYSFICSLIGCTPQTSASAAGQQQLDLQASPTDGYGTLGSCFYYDADDWKCNFTKEYNGKIIQIGVLTVFVTGNSCSTGSTLNTGGTCVSAAKDGDVCPDQSNAVITAECTTEMSKGAPPALSCVCDPINMAVGNVFESEVDLQPVGASPLSFSRAYNSLDGLWRHSFSTRLRFDTDKLSLVMADGRESFFATTDTTATPSPTELGNLAKQTDGTWIYTSQTNEQFTFDSTGRLTSQTSADGKQLQLNYAAGQVTVSDQFGHSLSYTEDANHQPLSLTAPGVQVAYNYDANNHLTSAVKTLGSLIEQRQYRYEDTRNTGLFTSVINERGVVASSWTYDAQGRAISNQSANGIGNAQIAYNDTDGSRAVTNELGKVATYKFVTIGGVQRVSAIVGSPSANCPASDSSYSYDNTRGLLTQKTDAKGFITQYTYNPRGLEIQRIEGSGSAQPRTTTTEWDSSRFLRTKVAGPTHTTVYSYDAQGRQFTQVITSNPTN